MDPEYDNLVINDADVTRLGTPRTPPNRDTTSANSISNRSEVVARGEQTKRDKLASVLEKHETLKDAVLHCKEPAVVSKHLSFLKLRY